MFGFHSYSESPFSTLTAAEGGGGAIQSGEALLQSSGEFLSSGSLYISSQYLLENSGSLDSNGSLYITSQVLLESSGTTVHDGSLYVSASNTLEGSGNLGVNGSLVASGASLVLDAGTTTANGTLIHGSDTVAENSGAIDASPSLILGVESTLTGSGTIGAGSAGGSTLAGASFLVDAGTLTSNGSLIATTSSSLEGSGTLSSNATAALDGAILKLNSGTVGANGTLINSGSTSLVNSGEVLPGGSLLAVHSTSLEGSGTLDSDIMVLRGIQAVVGTTYDEFLKTTQRLNYKPALPRLLHPDVALDFAINEGGGDVFSTSSRAQKGTIGNLSWGRVDGRQSLTSPGGSNDYRITASSNGLQFDNTTLYVSFKPTSSYPFPMFLFNMRGTSQNNNEIDIYCVTSTQTLYIDVYNGTTLQRTTVSGVSVNNWHNLAVTIGSDLKAYLNGTLAGTYSSITIPSTIDDSIYIGGTAGNDQAFRGSIDHFRWYNKQLSAVDITNLSKNISQDYYFSNLVPNHYEMSKITTGTPVLSHTLTTTLSGQATITAFPWLGGVSFESSGILTANGVLLTELDVVPFTANINQIEDSTKNIYQIYTKTTNINRLHTKSFEK